VERYGQGYPRRTRAGPGGGEVASTFPTRYLPPVTYRDMPEPLPLRKVLGPG
jgi:hypothetical protein